jgi:hypothetical protein
MDTLEAVNLRNLSRIAYGNGFTFWHYRAARLSDVQAPNFFIDAAGIVRRGDHILVSADDGGASFYVGKSGVRLMCKSEE